MVKKETLSNKIFGVTKEKLLVADVRESIRSIRIPIIENIDDCDLENCVVCEALKKMLDNMDEELGDKLI